MVLRTQYLSIYIGSKIENRHRSIQCKIASLLSIAFYCISLSLVLAELNSISVSTIDRKHLINHQTYLHIFCSLLLYQFRHHRIIINMFLVVLLIDHNRLGNFLSFFLTYLNFLERV